MSGVQQAEKLSQTNAAQQDQPRISWDIGTAYDFFISLEVILNPEHYGLRASWAAGVRSRLLPEERKFLDELHNNLQLPLHWVHSLPSPKDADTALWALRRIPAAERSLVLFNECEACGNTADIVKKIVEQRSWDVADLEDIRVCYAEHGKKSLSAKELTGFLNWMARPDEYGEIYLSLMQTYYQAFFAEEEKRIAPIVRDGLAHAQDLSLQMPLHELLVELTQGIHFEEPFDVSELVLVPGYWNTPYVIFPKIGPGTLLMVYGVRPANLSLVPGEQVPDALLLALKAIADPTRLKILRYLSRESLTPAQIARRLRLRAPTVTHHLTALRLAGLVYLSLDVGEERHYTARMEAIYATYSNLVDFLTENGHSEK